MNHYNGESFSILQIIITISIFYLLIDSTSGAGTIKRCFSCRSRGELGSCKDNFKFYNASQVEDEPGIEAVPCASGWCGKLIEASSSNNFEEYGVATQRMCLQRSPSDNEERCGDTFMGHKTVFMCFCRGDLCNSSKIVQFSLSILISCLSVCFYLYHS